MIMVASYIQTYVPSTNKLVSTNIEQTKVIQDIVSPEVSKLNYALLNKSTCQINILVNGDCVIKRVYNRSINSTINFFVCLKMIIM